MFGEPGVYVNVSGVLKPMEIVEIFGIHVNQ